MNLYSCNGNPQTESKSEILGRNRSVSDSRLLRWGIQTLRDDAHGTGWMGETRERVKGKETKEKEKKSHRLSKSLRKSAGEDNDALRRKKDLRKSTGEENDPLRKKKERKSLAEESEVILLQSTLPSKKKRETSKSIEANYDMKLLSKQKNREKTRSLEQDRDAKARIPSKVMIRTRSEFIGNGKGVVVKEPPLTGVVASKSALDDPDDEISREMKKRRHASTHEHRRARSDESRSRHRHEISHLQPANETETNALLLYAPRKPQRGSRSGLVQERSGQLEDLLSARPSVEELESRNILRYAILYACVANRKCHRCLSFRS